MQPSRRWRVVEGGSPALRERVVVCTVEGSLGGPDIRIDIDLALNPSAFDDPGDFIAQSFELSHLGLNLTVDLLL
jgi:hypothetical protein